MKYLGLIFGLVMLVGLLITDIVTSYKYEKEVESYWNLAEKASTIEQKNEYIIKFASTLKNLHLEGKYNSIFFKTPDNSFDENFKALESFQNRLLEIRDMDPFSFEYQMELFKIPRIFKEQGEANAMLSVFKSTWIKSVAIFIWDWIGALVVIFSCVAILASLVFIIDQ